MRNLPPYLGRIFPYKYLLINLTTVFDKLKLAHIAFPAVVVVEPVTPLIAKKDTLL